MKKIVSLIVISLMLVSASACTSGSKKPGATATDVTPEQIQQILEESGRSAE